jgi:hypothetical protein
MDRLSGRPGRRGRKWFSFDLPVDRSPAMILLVTYHTEERSKRTFDILVDGQRVGEQTIERNQPGSAVGHFFEVEYKIPADLVKDKTKTTIRFNATGGNEIGAVYGIRVVRADAKR